MPFLEHLNSFVPNIQSTMEHENNGEVAFLDIRRTAKGLKTSVCRKPTHTDRYLRFDSAQPMGQKRSFAAAPFSRASALSLVCTSKS
ncbi:hypothetical protein HPB50_025399 [Hyalomma asiaticum]|uniref:Uncharacterized protein n=1 Tax=Hyalomma asiaticum TaxID=266040 RepID=A0ACB7S6H5_HYAAI|nr:hypothetical protein HPB50_025399 [Hyalomma asiaticum]